MTISIGCKYEAVEWFRGLGGFGEGNTCLSGIVMDIGSSCSCRVILEMVYRSTSPIVRRQET